MDVESSVKTKAHLVQAKQICDDHWTKEAYGYGRRDIEGNVLECCIVGALTASLSNHRELCPAAITNTRDRSVLGEMVALVNSCAGVEHESDLYDWNDAPERTKDEVLQVLDCAISKA